MQLSIIFLAFIASASALPTPQAGAITGAASEIEDTLGGAAKSKRDFVSDASGNAVGNVGDGAKSLEQGGANNAANNVGNSEANLVGSAGNTVENL